MSITIDLPSDINGRFFVGPNGKVPEGTDSPNANYAMANVVLVDSNNVALTTTTDMDTGGGTALRGAFGLLLPSSGGPVLAPGNAANGLDVDVTRVADGADVVHGTTTDAAVAAGALGTTSAKLRRLTQDIGDLKLVIPTTRGGVGGMRVQNEERTRTPFSVAASVNSVISTVPGFLTHIHVINRSAAIKYLQIHDTASSVAGASTLRYNIAIPAGTANNPGERKLGADDFGKNGLHCTRGIAIGISTTDGTWNVATAADHSFSGSYRQDATLIVSDNFTRANSALTLGSAVTGQAWTNQGSAVYGITSNEGYCVSGVTGDLATLDAGVTDGAVELRQKGTLNSGATFRAIQPFARFVNTSTFILMYMLGGNIVIAKFVSGVLTTPATTTTTTADNTYYIMRLVAIGRTLQGYIDGTWLYTYTMTDDEYALFGRSTTCGLRYATNGSPAFDARMSSFAFRAWAGIP